MADPVLSVVVPAYNRAALLDRALAALVSQTLDAALYEIVVVDDGSTDETPAIARRRAATDARLHLVRHAANRGRGAARNTGVRTARGRIIVLIDGDILVRPDFLAHHLAAHERAGRPILCRGPVVELTDGQLPERLPSIPPSPAYLTTANASLPRSELLAAGLFDEHFRAYGWEDIDLGFRLQRRGLPRVYRREAIAFHVQPPLEARPFAEALAKEEERAHSALQLYAKHPRWRTRLLIQQTPLHRALYFLMAMGGVLNARTAPALAARLRQRGAHQAADLVLRSVLNRHYLGVLRREWAARQEGPR